MRRLEAGLILLSLGFLGLWAFHLLEARAFQAAARERLREPAAGANRLSSPSDSSAGGAERTASSLSVSSRGAPPPPKAGDLLGLLEIPRLKISAAIAEGTTSRTLHHAVGHIEGTAAPGQPGTLGLAGHRDSYFHPLRLIRLNDTLQVSTRDSLYAYIVDSLSVVPPESTSVLQPTRRPSLTLVTCYPFSYLGLAPLRFVVRAHDAGVTALPAAPSGTAATGSGG